MAEKLATEQVHIGFGFSPETSLWLTDGEKFMAAERLRIKPRSHSNQQVKPHHIKRAILDINDRICSAGFFCTNITVQGLSVFKPTILKDLGWTTTRAQLYSVPVYVSVSAIAMFIAFVSDKTRQRGLYLAAFTIPGITGFALLRWNLDANVQHGTVYLCALIAFPGRPGCFGWIVTLGAIGGVVATWWYLATDGPDFPTGHPINLIAHILVLCLSVGGIAYCIWENKLRALGGRDDRLHGLNEEEIAGSGYRHSHFRCIP
ncbi:hypothetical protein DOTSEDRAFT_85703 [Dothistroma septosporum NZE10]|uniref:Major facilitator superfamily (MFS) profile domain-containing protein n=1 Tax=Dothistroma septosporum (strain NZE10 / CBS 128990) TaxID=675120 RepID=N1PXL0_DOTSN|nr:hypothetical protein DOTSEDRAFT_85703 [Dothistroma septosporum NZE10]